MERIIGNKKVQLLEEFTKDTGLKLCVDNRNQYTEWLEYRLVEKSPIQRAMPSVYGIFKHGMDKAYGYYWKLEVAEEVCDEMNGDDYYVDELCVGNV